MQDTNAILYRGKMLQDADPALADPTKFERKKIELDWKKTLYKACNCH